MMWPDKIAATNPGSESGVRVYREAAGCFVLKFPRVPPWRDLVVDMTRLALSLVLALFACGCACTKPEHGFAKFAFSDSDLARYRSMAIRAASSPETWQRFHATRIGRQPLKLEASPVEYRFDSEQPHLIQLFMDTGEPYGMHSCYVAVTIRCGGENQVGGEDRVVGIEESWWP